MRGPASCARASFNELGIKWRLEEARFQAQYSDSSLENSTSKECRACIKYIDEDDDNDDNNNYILRLQHNYVETNSILQ